MRIPSITFQANTADYVNVDPDKAAKNPATISRLAEIFKKYATYKIQIEGHANLVNFDNPAKAKIEQEQELLPLSKKRADAIRDALVAQGSKRAASRRSASAPPRRSCPSPTWTTGGRTGAWSSSLSDSSPDGRADRLG